MATQPLRKVLLKVLIIGDAGVGKTSLLERFVNKRFSETYRATIGADFLIKDIVVGDAAVTMQIWDTAGQERFQSLGNAFYRGSDCCVLVFDVNVASSFEHLQRWKDEFIAQAQIDDKDNFPFVVMGNKVDRPDERVIREKTARRWCEEQGVCGYYEVSAKQGANVDAAFEAVVSAALKNLPEEDVMKPQPFQIKQENTKGPCCG